MKIIVDCDISGFTDLLRSFSGQTATVPKWTSGVSGAYSRKC